MTVLNISRSFNNRVNCHIIVPKKLNFWLQCCHSINEFHCEFTHRDTSMESRRFPYEENVFLAAQEIH
jgi:hypothetical protein